MATRVSRVGTRFDFRVSVKYASAFFLVWLSFDINADSTVAKLASMIYFRFDKLRFA